MEEGVREYVLGVESELSGERFALKTIWWGAIRTV